VRPAGDNGEVATQRGRARAHGAGSNDAEPPPSVKEGELRERLRVAPGKRFHLADVDPDATFGFEKSTAEPKVARDLDRLEKVQDRLWAERKHRILIVLQGIDTSGKDGAIRHVMSAFNPQGCRAVPFGVPTVSELAHDYLWRIHAQVPGSGEIVIFNRSHYESVMVERVHQLVPEATWSQRYAQINAFEELLVREGTTILKFFLHIDRDEQLARLKARYDEPDKRWKFKVGDLKERALWDAYMASFQDAIDRCSTKLAPWYVIPANHKWFRNLAIAEIVATDLEELDPHYPAGEELPPGVALE
jgi:PPK2 family polyphosphate:nucleotide phosphotransferase